MASVAYGRPVADRSRRTHSDRGLFLLAALVAFVSLTMVGSVLIEELALRQRRLRGARDDIHVPAE